MFKKTHEDFKILCQKYFMLFCLFLHENMVKIDIISHTLVILQFIISERIIPIGKSYRSRSVLLGELPGCLLTAGMFAHNTDASNFAGQHSEEKLLFF